ncbi:LysR substrate-binding domain-containing protein [Mangrovibrevibacter kandeliae]|uniref:LysR substrate-binding domain-containing protein n=1 Tax=Mangrovibrevibacter kandeliae TaxID=2968473 RepID=UPI00211875BA|nr:LysR substrate-binding domain-containing protein [Aurantimonas sp. CSK15Z-1]MCQ8781843.1 LysR substrate-binding domain-containing protein [Aurantimonas sp. CSK15Z-1]
MDRLDSMEVFVRAVDAGSFAAASKTLGMSAQMVGKHVAALEGRLGTTLLRRTTRRQSLTDIGHLFYARCRAILSEAAAADALVQDMSETPRGRLRVSAPIGFGACRLAPMVTRYLRDHPMMEVELTLTDRYVDIVDEGYDAVIRLGPIPNSSLAARRLMDHRQVACASPAYLAAHGAPTTPEELRDHTCLAYLNFSGRPYAEWVFSKNGMAHPIRIESRFQINDGRALVAAALDGQGIVLQPEAVLGEALAAGRLLPILADYQAPSRPMYLMFMPRRPQLPRLRSFIDTVVTAFGRDPERSDGPDR